MDELPNKIIDIKILKINRNIRKHCTCSERTYTIDQVNREITCDKCGAIIDPFEVVVDIAYRRERLREETNRLLEQRKEIINYNPHLLVFRSLEQSYRGKRMLPVCPECGKAFYFEKITSWTNRRSEEQRRLEATD